MLPEMQECIVKGPLVRVFANRCPRMFPADYVASHAEQPAGASDARLIDILDNLGYLVRRAKSEAYAGWLIGWRGARTSRVGR
jgi:hypothetical protein